KCIFNLVPCDNEFEKEFARFLQKAPDVKRFAKLPERFGFVIEYMDGAGNLRYYEPDFVVLTGDGIHYIVETKGLGYQRRQQGSGGAAMVREHVAIGRQAMGLSEGLADRVQT